MQAESAAAARLEELAAEFWKVLLEHHPLFASAVSVREHEHRLEDASAAARDAHVEAARRIGERVRAVPEAGLTRARRVTRAMLLHEIDSTVAMAATRMDRWAVDQLGGPQVTLLDLPRIHALRDARSLETLTLRVRAMPAHLAQHADVLRESLAAGLSAARCAVVRVVQQLDDVLVAGPRACSLVTATTRRPEGVDDAAWTRFREELPRVVEEELFPALARHRDALRDEVLPASRTRPGLCAVPGGEEAYRAAIRAHVTLDLSPAELHETGLAENARIRAEMKALLADLFPGMELEAALAELRNNPAHSFSSREEILRAASSAVRRATEAARRVFRVLPDHECAVSPMDAHAEKAAPAAYYLGPAPDGTRPGTYYVNTWEPTSRPRHEAEVVAFHEAVPGHHLQIALAQRMTGVPEFQKHAHSTAYVEGWALYTERLANELGLYSGPADLLGMLSCDAWRASRLVVDTGLHALDWSREKAIAYMVANTAASLTDIENEVDRYVAWPGQALSYKTGQIEILRLRRRAEERLGSRFDLADFHAVVLRDGGVTLPILRAEVERWIEGGDAA